MTFSKEPKGIIGGGLGLGIHKVGAEFLGYRVGGSKANFLLLGFGDFGIIQLGGGNFGIRPHIDLLVPDISFGVGITPRYKLIMNFSDTEPLFSLEPWGGWNFELWFIEGVEVVFINTGLSIGADVELFAKNLYLFFEINLNFLGIPRREYEISINYTNYLIKLGAAYRIY